MACPGVTSIINCRGKSTASMYVNTGPMRRPGTPDDLTRASSGPSTRTPKPVSGTSTRTTSAMSGYW